jgi:hypothetical protein
MTTKRNPIQICLLWAAMLPAAVQAQFLYTTNNGTITITGYTGPGGAVTIPSTIISRRVTSIGYDAFSYYTSLNSVYFQGNAPSFGADVFDWWIEYWWPIQVWAPATIYYLPGTTGWSQVSANTGLPVVLWNPLAQTGDASFGVHTNRFGFNITGSSNLVIVVEACTNLASAIWSPVSSNTLNTFIGTIGTSYFSDSQWTNYPGRFYVNLRQTCFREGIQAGAQRILRKSGCKE